MASKTKYHGKKHFCRYCLQCFSSSKVLECHVKHCLAINHKKSVLLPEEGQYINFEKCSEISKRTINNLW